jgi:trans-aconitate methyltransferase
MASTSFAEISARYRKDSIIQQSAAERLLELLEIRNGESVLDLGCGTGNLTRRLRALTDGVLVGVDPTAGMIAAARADAGSAGIDFRQGAAECLAFRDSFDVVFCNSAFQWFASPQRALDAAYAALNPGGRIGIQAPATSRYCPNFLAALEAVRQDPRTAPTFANCRPRWTFLETAGEYAALLERAGFAVHYAAIEQSRAPYTPEQVFTIFESGAAAGYLNRDAYPEEYPSEYPAQVRALLAEAFRQQAGADGQVQLTFNRVYLVGVKS